jgi:hypothetical protein
MPRYRLHYLSLVLLLVLVPACRRDTPAPDMPPTPSSDVSDVNVLGVATLDISAATPLSSQALVPELRFSLLDSQLLDGDGVRVRQLTLEVQNDSERNLSNLTFYSLQTANTFSASNVSNLRDVLGTPLTDEALAQSIIPVHGQSSFGVIDPALADMQAFNEDDQARVQGLLADAYPDTADDFVVLARGFVASNSSGQQNRAIAAGETGIITIAVQYPFDVGSPAGYPDVFTLSFAFVDEPTPRFTQGLGESNADFLDRLESYGGVPAGSQIVASDPDDPPNPSDVPTQNPNPTPADEPTIITAAPFNPPISQAPTSPTNPTDPALPDTFTLSVGSLIVSAEVEVDVSIAASVRRTLVWE